RRRSSPGSWPTPGLRPATCRPMLWCQGNSDIAEHRDFGLMYSRLRGALQDAQEEADALQLRLASLQGEARAGRERSDATGALVLDLLARLAMSREQGAPDGSGPALLRDGG
ncbi:unnamed protein product, partial [Prorocentrum cordatum]